MGVRLPPEYQEVEYLESTGEAQWIDVGFPITDTLSMELTFSAVTIITTKYYMGFYSGNSGDFYIYNSMSKFQTVYGCSYLGVVGKSVDTEKHTYYFAFENGNAVVRENGNIIISATKFKPLKSNKHIMIAGTGFSDQNKVRTYAFVAHDGANKVANFVPCYRKSDNKPGMYDLVSDEFFTNAGTGEFLVGPDVIGSISPLMVAWRRMLMKYPELYPVGTNILAKYGAVFVSKHTIDTITGEYVEKISHQASPVYMPISPKYTYWKRGIYPNRGHLSVLAFYDKDKNYISYYAKNEYNDFVIPDIPANARYARIAIPSGSATDVKIIRTA